MVKEFKVLNEIEVIEGMIAKYLQKYESKKVWDEETAFIGCGYFRGVEEACKRFKLVSDDALEYYGYRYYED